jgi:hypothetical protein
VFSSSPSRYQPSPSQCDEDYARDLLDEALAEIATAPTEVQDVLRRLLHHHLATDFSSSVEIVNDEPGTIELFHRYIDPAEHSLN